MKEIRKLGRFSQTNGGGGRKFANDLEFFEDEIHLKDMIGALISQLLTEKICENI